MHEKKLQQAKRWQQYKKTQGNLGYEFPPPFPFRIRSKNDPLESPCRKIIQGLSSSSPWKEPQKFGELKH